MSQEIERKYLVVGEFKHLAHTSMRLTQGYIASGRRTVRVRVSDKGAWLTIKGASHNGGLSRYEWEKEISLKDALELLQLSEGAVIDKERFLIAHENHTIEVDVFHGENEGLMLAEIELDSESDTVNPPKWLGREVTGIKRYYNSNLREHPYSKWSPEEREL